MINEEEYLQKGAELIRDHEITLTEEGMLDLLQIKYRWPEPAIEVINQVGNTSNGFFDQRKFLIYERWKRLYDLGFTTLMSNVMDLTSELRSLDDKLYEYKGSETNANLYFSYRLYLRYYNVDFNRKICNEYISKRRFHILFYESFRKIY